MRNSVPLSIVLSLYNLRKRGHEKATKEVTQNECLALISQGHHSLAIITDEGWSNAMKGLVSKGICQKIKMENGNARSKISISFTELGYSEAARRIYERELTELQNENFDKNSGPAKSVKDCRSDSPLLVLSREITHLSLGSPPTSPPPAHNMVLNCALSPPPASTKASPSIESERVTQEHNFDNDEYMNNEYYDDNDFGNEQGVLFFTDYDMHERESNVNHIDSSHLHSSPPQNMSGARRTFSVLTPSTEPRSIPHQRLKLTSDGHDETDLITPIYSLSSLNENESLRFDPPTHATGERRQRLKIHPVKMLGSISGSLSEGHSNDYNSNSISISSSSSGGGSGSGIDRVDDCPSTRIIVHDPSEWEVTLLVDSREEHANTICASMMSRGIACDTQMLSLGDFLWVARKKKSQGNAGIFTAHMGGGAGHGDGHGDGDDEDNDRQSAHMKKSSKSHKKKTTTADKMSSLDEDCIVLDCIAERKVADDLAKSIRDGRYMEQKVRLRECGLAHRIYLLEAGSLTVSNFRNKNFFKGHNHPVTSKELRAALISTMINFGFHILHTRSLDQTIRLLQSIHKNVMAAFSSGSSVGRGYLSFTDFQRRNAKKQALTVSDVFVGMLRQIQGCSISAVIAISKRFVTIAGIISELKQMGKYQAIQEIANLRKAPPHSDQRLGPTLAESIWGYFGEPFEVTTTKRK